MKPLTVGLIFFLVTLAGFGQGGTQANATRYPDLPYLNHIYVLVGDSLVSLEQIDARYMMHPPVPFGKSEDGLSMNGDKSPVRIKAGDSLRFLIKLTNSMMDPTSLIRLYSLRSKKGKREAVLSSTEDHYFYNKSNDNTGGVRFNVQKSGTDVFVMVPVSRLSSGEFAFMNSMLVNGGGPHATYTLYAFGIDP